MYEQRFIAFIDILGFGSLVEKSSKDPGLVRKILSALYSMAPDNAKTATEHTLNFSKIPEAEHQEHIEFLKTTNEILSSYFKVDISYFSDWKFFYRSIPVVA